MTEHELTTRVGLFVLQLAVILIAAKLAGELATRVRQPAVVGELLAGVAIGPHALGGVTVLGLGPLFPRLEGTVLAAAVVDDVLAIMALALAVGAGSGALSVGQMTLVGLKAFAAWAALTVLFVTGARALETTLRAFRATGARLALSLAACFLAEFVAESFGLAMIIGAYSAGLGLSPRPLGRHLREELEAVYHFLVPVFFVVIGMLVNAAAMGDTLMFGVVVTTLAIVTKLVGCGAPALAAGFTSLGAARIGVGMLPRGEIALVIATLGLAARAIDETTFGVAVLMTLVTTLLAPVLLVPLFRRSGDGRRPR